MRLFALCILASFLATGILGAATNRTDRAERISPATGGTNDPVEAAYKKLLAEDDAAQEEVDQWIKDNEKFAAAGAGLPPADLNRRIRERFDPVRKGYEDFIKQHPKHARARIAYGSFLGDINDEDGAQEQLEKALELDTNTPSVYNNLANKPRANTIPALFHIMAKGLLPREDADSLELIR